MCVLFFLQEKQLSSCRKQLTTVEGEMNYVRDQVTTTEVSLARVYNYDVARRKSERVNK